MHTRLALVALLLLLAACGNEPAATERPASFAEPRLTWAQESAQGSARGSAQGSTIHYGEEELSVDGYVDALWRTPYAFIADVRSGPGFGQPSHEFLVTAEGSEPLPGEVADVHASPDGRYAGWVDFEGPRRINGRLAQIVVVDLRTGATVFRDHDQMGDASDDLQDLYEDAEVHFLGFDDEYVYWDTPVGDIQRRRARIGEWKAEDAEKPAPAGLEGDFTPIGLPYDSLRGRDTGMREDGRESPDHTGLGGFVSPDGRWCLSSGNTGRLTAVDCRSGAAATPSYPFRWVFFGGWSDPDTFYVLARPRYDFDIDPVGKDPSTGVIASCSLTTRLCQTVQQVRRTDSIVFAIGASAL